MRFIDINLFELETPETRMFAALKLKALMFWPEDDFQRFDFLASSIKKMAEVTATRLDMGVTFEKSFYQLEGGAGNSDPIRMIEEATEYVVSGPAKAPGSPKNTASFIAGCVLLDALQLQLKGDNNISLKRLLEIRSKSLYGSKNSRPQDLGSHWRAHRNVAHLCAAEIFLNFCDLASNLEKFLMVAERFRTGGINIKNVHAQGPLLDPKASWQLSSEIISRITRT